MNIIIMEEKQSNSLDYVAIGQRVKAMRLRMGWTQQKLAEEMGVSTSYIGHIEYGMKRSSAETIARLCQSLEMDANYLLFGTSVSGDNKSIIRVYLEHQLAALDEIE